MNKIYLILVIVVLGLFLGRDFNLAQEMQVPSETLSEPETQWLWGEVASIDIPNKIIVVKYLDYETETEKEIIIAIDEKTTFENIKSLDELKPQDAVSIDYIISPEGKNLAQNISVEKPETEEVVP